MKKKASFVLLLLSSAIFCAAQKSNVDVDELIKKMSIEEKVGQMTQVDLGVIAKGNICALANPQQLDATKLQEAITKYKIGSVLNVGCASGTISLDNWHSIINTIHEQNAKLSARNIPIIYGIDAIHGANYTMGATLFPQQIAQAATWNPALVQRGYEITAYETRASGIPWNFSPVLDLGRQPLWSRFFETFGEDVCLAKKMACVAIKGQQGSSTNSATSVAACMKHFLGYSLPLSGKDRTPAWISDRELREYFLPTFQEAINSGAKTIMINSGDINGTPVHANYDILTTLLRKELGFKGVAVTDWEDIYKLVNLHRVVATKKEAVKLAIMSGIDMSMTPNDFEVTTLLVQLVKEGSIPMSRIDLSVKRILQLKKDLGLFEHTHFAKSSYPLFGSKAHAQASLAVAQECITLLKNEKNVLPLKQEKIFVCGPGANSMNALNGAWTHTWQGVDTQWNTPSKLTIVDALIASKANVAYQLGTTYDSAFNIQACAEQAATADKIIVCLAEKPSAEIPGNINELALPQAQVDLVNALAATGKPLILICNFGRPRIITTLAQKADAILYAYFSGDEGGQAIANTLLGSNNPSGKLPFTYPRAEHAIVHYDHKRTEDMDIDFSMNAYKPLFDFGYGLSYTTFHYSNLSTNDSVLKKNGKIIVKVNVKNTGSVHGKEVVQVYYNDLVASITPSVKKLVAFQKIDLAPGETKTVSFEILAKDFSFINKELRRVTEAGDIEILINNLKKNIYAE